MTTRVPWMAANKALSTHNAPTDHSIRVNGLIRISTTTWVKTAYLDTGNFSQKTVIKRKGILVQANKE